MIYVLMSEICRTNFTKLSFYFLPKIAIKILPILLQISRNIMLNLLRESTEVSQISPPFSHKTFPGKYPNQYLPKFPGEQARPNKFAGVLLPHKCSPAFAPAADRPHAFCINSQRAPSTKSGEAEAATLEG